MCTRADRLAGRCGSVDIGHGYKASVGGDSVIIYPTKNVASCTLTMGLGDAIFTINPQDPPSFLTRVITRDADGRYAPQINFGKHRHTKTFSSVNEIVETHTDADGVVTNIPLKILSGYEEKTKEGTYYAQGYRNIKQFPSLFW